MNITEINLINPPADKSITHRILIISSISKGVVRIKNALIAEDTLATINALRALGVEIEILEGLVIVRGVGLRGLKAPKGEIDCHNSGTTMRLLTGILAGQNFSSKLIGDESLMKRPMRRLKDPLTQMGAIITLDGDKPPINIRPSYELKSVEYKLKVPSAQVLSAMELLDLYTIGESKISHIKGLRDHTSRMLKYFKEKDFYVDYYEVAGDFSSASFFIIWALINNMSLKIRNTGINQGRIGLLKVLWEMDADIAIENKRVLQGEEIGELIVRPSILRPIEITFDIIPSMIDEIPVLVVLSLFIDGVTIIRGLEELRYKESDRLSLIVKDLEKIGAEIWIEGDDLFIRGERDYIECDLSSHNDHRLAMSYHILKSSLNWNSKVLDDECINISYPDFFKDLRRIEDGQSGI